ncbi:MAG TPA: biotin/lipoyl-containing protein [Steroidobacteraceae bacterium]|nr:biotin/lipoyl-containing protein [Steroidobacteraceae bacterium]
MSLSAKDVAAILQALEASSFDTLDLELNGVKLQLRRSGSVAQPAMPRAPTAASTEAAARPVTAASAVPVEAPPGTAAVPAPLLGIFYRAPKPGEPPFVDVGSRVEADTIIGIIEVMKLMNTVRAGQRGEVVAIPARNGELVEYGEALLFVRPD